MQYVYMLKCSDNSFYTGRTGNIDERIKRHQEGRGAGYTDLNGPVELVYFEECDDLVLAIKREKAIKKLSVRNKIRLINWGKRNRLLPRVLLNYAKK